MTGLDPAEFSRAYFAAGLTEPLNRAELCRLFDYHPNRYGELAKTLDGLVHVGRRVRVPIRLMPPKYMRAAKLIAPGLPAVDGPDGYGMSSF